MSATTAGPAIFQIDNAHTSVEFVARHLMIAKVRGRFGTVAGSITLGESGNLPSQVEVTIQTGSIDTGEPQRDGHLKSDDFLNAEKYPTITFKSTKIAGSEESFTMTGDLTIRDVTKTVDLKGELAGRVKDPWGNDRLAYAAEGEINRKDFGASWNQALETGGVVVGDKVKIEIAVQAIRA